MVEQKPFFTGLKFERVVFDYPFGSVEAHKGINGCYYRVDAFDKKYVIEEAETKEMAALNQFEDGDLFDANLPTDELVKKIRQALMEYTASDKMS